MTDPVQEQTKSPQWGSGIKLVVSLTLTAILIGLVIRFRNIIGPLLLIFVLAYLIYPIAVRLSRRTKLKWRATVTLLYIFMVLILAGLLTWGGVAIASQIQSLISFIQRSLVLLPDFLNNISSQGIQIGNFYIDLSKYGLTDVGTQILNALQPLLGQMGSLVGALAGGAAEVLGWLFFVLLVSYFILVESDGPSGKLLKVDLPGYAADFRRMSVELSKIWNAFLRGQFLVIAITVVVYMVLLSILGVRYSLGLALLAGLARFVPYIGPAIAWTTFGFVSFFQSFHPFGISPLVFTLIVVGVSWFTDVLLDNLVATRILSKALKIHPAAVLVAAIILANLIGFIGVVLASPVVATLKLFFRYVIRKLLDQDPWEGLEEEETPVTPPRIVIWLVKAWHYLYRRTKKTISNIKNK